MSGVERLTPEFVDSFPAEMASGILYVSIAYRTTGHLCCCGCGNEVIAPLAPAQWALTYDGHNVSLAPSIGNWSLECQSHYVIRRNRVLWRPNFTPKEIADNRANDRAVLDHFEQTEADAPINCVSASVKHEVLARKARRWFGRH